MLLLLQPVTVVKDISNQSVFTNKEAVFECEVKINYPEITLSWYKGTQKLDTNDKYDISITDDRHLLKIKNCQSSDQGNYRVVCGPHISSAKLTVMGQYLKAHDSLSLDCDAKPLSVCVFQRQKLRNTCRTHRVRKASRALCLVSYPSRT